MTDLRSTPLEEVSVPSARSDAAVPASLEARERRQHTLRRVVLPSLLVLTPLLIVFTLFLFWPIFDILLRSLNPSGRAALEGITGDNYANVLSDDFLLTIELRTLALALWTTLLTTVLGFPVAYLLSRLRPRIAGVLLLAVLIPYFVPTVVRLFSLTVVLSPNGLINSISEALGFGSFDLLFNTTATVIGMTVYKLPLMILLMYAGLSRIDTTLLVAARTLGARPLRAFVSIYLPLAWPVIVSSMLLIFVMSLSFFLVPAILGGADNQTISVFIRQRIEFFEWGLASTMGILLLFVTLVGYILSLRLGGGATVAVPGHVASKGASDREPLRGTVGTWVSVVISAIAALLLIVPVLIVFPLSIGESPRVQYPPQGFTLDWFLAVFTGKVWIPAFSKSLVVALATAVLAVGLSLSLARVMQRITRPIVRALIFAVAFAPMITPAILLAIGIYDVQIQLGLIGTDIGLILAHTVVAFPLAFAVVNNALMGSDINLEHAAWTMGASRTRTFWDIVVRSKIAAIVGAGVAAFMVSWDDVVIALFQTGLAKTLPVTIYSYLETGVVPEVPAISSMLVLLVLGGMVIWLLFSRRAARRSVPTQQTPQEGK